MDAATITPGLHDRRPAAFHAAPCSPSGRTHLDLFSGIGGFALAARWTGWNTIALSEIEPYANRVLAKNFPGVPNLGDIRNVRGVRAALVTGGFPCQPFSHAGKRAGAADDRYLWPEMLRVIKDTRASWVIAENVPGIIGMGIETVLSDLETSGYRVATLLIPACGVGAPHRRRRVWIVAESLNPDANGVGWDRTEMHEHGEELRAERDHEQIGDSRPLVSGEVWQSFASGVLRVADGLPDRVDRLRAVGNAIVPQIAAVLMREMARMENKDYAT